MSGGTEKPALDDLEDLPVLEGEGVMEEAPYTPSLGPDPVEPADVRWPPRRLAIFP